MADPQDPRSPQQPSHPKSSSEPGQPWQPAQPAYMQPEGHAYAPPGYGQPGLPGYGPGQPGYWQTERPAYGQPAHERSGQLSAAPMTDQHRTRLKHRPQPRLGVSLAGIGAGLTILGVITWGGDYLITGISVRPGAGDSHRALGIALSLIVVVAGYLLAIVVRRGPLATAGVVANGLGVPVLLAFLTISVGSSSGAGPTDAIVLISVAVWIISYVAVPGCRGHAFYLGLVAVIFWIYVVNKASPPALFSVFVTRRGSPASFATSGSNHLAITAGVSLAFGLSYYLSSYLFDRGKLPGIAAPLALGGFVATAVGIGAAAPSLHAIGTAVLLIMLGAPLAGYGARYGRRFTTWVWSASIGLGVIVIIVKVSAHNTAAAGIGLIACGILIVLIAQLASTVFSEPEEIQPN